MAERFAQYLQISIHPDWKPFFGAPRLRFAAILDILAAKADMSPICPQERLVFEAFRISPHAIKMVILGQDPYYTTGAADGLAFSDQKRGGTPQPSLKRIFEAIDASYPGVFDLSSTSLKLWMFCGAFLINTALSTEEGKAGAHLDIWKAFSLELMKYLGSLPGPIHFVLWGSRAFEFEKHIGASHMIHKYHHPSPATCKPFIDCPVFRNIQGFDWGTSHEWRVYTDGSGVSSSWGTWSVVFNHAGIGSFAGEVVPYRYRLGEMKIETDPNYPVNATAQRGELLAIAYAVFIFMNLQPMPGNLTIVSDSRNSVGTITEWYDNRKAKGKETKMENLDIIEMIMPMIDHLRNGLGISVDVIHIAAHQQGDSPDVQGNREADRIAGSPLIRKGSSIWRSNPNIWVNI